MEDNLLSLQLAVFKSWDPVHEKGHSRTFQRRLDNYFMLKIIVYMLNVLDKLSLHIAK